MPKRNGSLTRTRSKNGNGWGRFSSNAAMRIKKAQDATRRANAKWKASASRDQYTQAGWTIAGGAAGGAVTSQLPDGVMGIDARLVGGILLATGCVMVKNQGISRPMCGLASGLLASWISETTESLLASPPEMTEDI